MASRVQTFVQRPWSQGLHTALNAAMISPDELTLASNVVFDTSGSRKSRAPFRFFDYIGVGVSRSATGTTRTVVVTLNTGFSIALGEEISVDHVSNINSDYDTKRAEVTAVSNVGQTYTITYDLGTIFSEGSTADTDIRVGLYTGNQIIGVKDFWYTNAGAKIQKRISVTDNGKFYEYDVNGSKSEITQSGLSLTTPIESCSFAVLGNKLLIAFSGIGNKPVIWDGTSSITHAINRDFDGNDVSGTNPIPDLFNLRVHQGRIWALDKDNKDRLHYSDIA